MTDAETTATMLHLEKCGPFCTHIEFCPQCVNVFGLCREHRTQDAGRARFKRVRKELTT